MFAPDVNTEVDDFFARHLDDIAEAMKPEDVLHRPNCRHGKRIWLFTCYWPFVETWISKAVCCCDVNALLAKPTVRMIDLGGLSPRKQRKAIREWTTYIDQLALRKAMSSHRQSDQIIAEIRTALNTSASWHAKMKSLEQ